MDGCAILDSHDNGNDKPKLKREGCSFVRVRLIRVTRSMVRHEHVRVVDLVQRLGEFEHIDVTLIGPYFLKIVQACA